MHTQPQSSVVPTRRHRPRARLVVVGAVMAVVAGAAPLSPAAAQVPEPVARAAAAGQTADTAAASCWEIKQIRPTAPSGSYWLVTPTLVAPRQFHCDMTTDGGGWVLIGRGRDRWDFSYNGQGTTDEVRGAIDGPTAFTPRTLASEVVDGLLDGARPDDLTDGIRLRRATTADGTGRQEVRFSLTNRDRWVWSFDAAHPVGPFSFDTTTGSGGSTRSFGIGTGLQRVETGTTGWGFGADIGATAGTSSYLAPSSFGNNALPFTQVYIRPRLTAANTSFVAVPDAGLPASAQPRLLSNFAERGEWGVTGNANGQTGELDTEVQAFTQSGDRMIVGGNFEYVQKGANATGTNKVRQPFLAAFDVTTGAWLPDFRPTLNNQVKDLHTLPDGTIVAAGEFTTVNGASRVGLVALDPATGRTSPSLTVAVENRIDGTGVSVRALDVEDGWLYLGGRFTHLTGGGRPTVFARHAARVSLATGAPDLTWVPDLNGSVVDLDASDRGDRVYLAGYFTQSKGLAAPLVAVLTTASGAGQVPGLAPPRFSTNPGRYQQAILEVGDRVWQGGAEHMLFSYDRSTFTRLSGNITIFGGDFQALTTGHGVVYGGCHCGDINYSGIYDYVVGDPARLPAPGFTQADNIGFTGAWDATTGDYLPDFVPEVTTTRARGPWDLTFDDSGALWMGGDFARARTTSGQLEWVGGFVRYRERDSQAPTRPGALSGSDQAGTTTFAWGPSTDDRGSVGYELLRHDRVVATTSARQLTVPSAEGGGRWFVRAIDPAGNRSATTTVLVTTSFIDTAGNTHAANIDAIAELGITVGCDAARTRYCPGDDVSREQMASFLVRAFDLPPATRDHFDDDSTSSHQDSINRLAEAGITTGRGARRFAPGDSVSREQMATFLTNALDLTPRPSGPFTDVGGVHAPNVNAVSAAGITKGCNPDGTRYCPGTSVKRDQMASFLARALGID